VYNVGTGEHRPNLDVVRAICRLLADEAGLDHEHLLGRIRFVPDRPGHDRCYRVDTGRVHRLGWSPRVGFEDGLKRTVRWYLEHQEWLAQATAGDYAAYYRAVYVRQWGQAESGSITASRPAVDGPQPSPLPGRRVAAP
jgi:dTDP-glucose 4,6-dehydratase